MKKLAWLAWVPLAVVAGPREDFAWQWPLRTSEDAGAYRAVLDDSVYQRLHSPALRDLDVIDARAQPVPAAVIVPEAAQPALDWREVPWFDLPDARASANVAAISEIASDGSVRRVEWQAAQAGVPDILIDVSQLRQPLRFVQLRWASGQAPFDHAYRVLASDDLKDWRVIEDEAHLIELGNHGQRVLRDRIALPDLQTRYVRLSPVGARTPALQLLSARAAVAVAPADESDWRWRTLEGRRVQSGDGQVRFEFTLDGRFPIARADVQLPGNHSQQWRLETRDTETASWREAGAAWVAYQVQDAHGSNRSAPQELGAINRDRQWRLTTAQISKDATPRLRLGYRPEVIAFIAQGQAPYTLVAGSARAVRGEASVEPMFAALRAQRGQGWEPSLATLDAPVELAGATAMRPAEPERDWKAWLLWSLLIAGALLVTGFALSLLRKPAA